MRKQIQRRWYFVLSKFLNMNFEIGPHTIMVQSKKISKAFPTMLGSAEKIKSVSYAYITPSYEYTGTC